VGATPIDCELSVLASLDHDVSRRGAYQAFLGSGEHPVRLRVLESLDHDVSRRGAYQVYAGSGEYPVRVRVLGRDAIPPGGEGLVRLHLPVALPLLPGDRFVLRESGRGETVGGGEVLDVAPVLPASKARPDRSVDRVVAERGWVGVDELERLTGERRDATIGRWVVSAGAVAAATERVRSAVHDAGPMGVEIATFSERERAVLPLIDDVVVDAGRARVPEAVDPLADHPFVAALEAGGYSPPGADGVDRAELRELIRRGLVVERDGVYFAPSVVDEAAKVAARLIAEKPDGFTVAEIRDALGTTRKFILPLVGHLDASGVTRRRGDLRIAGPRLPNSLQ
jgi:selenocysteine-specific elongation factor